MKQVVNEIEKAADSVVKGAKTTVTATVKTVEGAERILDKQIKVNQRVFERHPFILGALSTFGLVAVITGFEQVMLTVPFIKENPLILLLGGLFVLTMTGVLYTRLQQG